MTPLLSQYALTTTCFAVWHPQIKHPVFGRKATLRGAQTDKYKLNFSPIQHKRGVEAGLTFVYDLGDPEQSLYEWFRGVLDLLI